MSKKARKEAIRFLCNNPVIREKFRIALGLSKDTHSDEVRSLMKAIIDNFYHNGPRDEFGLLTGGLTSVVGGKSLRGNKLDNEDILDILSDNDYEEPRKQKKQRVPDFLRDLNNK